ncbi:hypothetical protein C2G38_2034356 [Gigaspora rosea]|uniref:Uncharacterized protein n=1 Tax=Gigaspora rosea TaxID=44941 RepID=A0A397VQP6_9GLOM|nr:hypothetical protein C2G38_2034356 [Gigaspora rosea]CAG8716705.1 22893_t:CDS:1 [Gigaspora rosea]
MLSEIQSQGLVYLSYVFNLRNLIMKIVLWYSHKLQYVVVPRSYEETIGLDYLVVISEERLSALNWQWDQNKVNLLCSPPASGKTTFAKWIELCNKDHNLVVLRISMSCLNGISGVMDNENAFNAAWKKFSGEP